MTTNNQRLKRLMARFSLTQTEVQELAGRGRTAVYYWTRDPSDPNYQEMHNSDLRLIKFELGVVTVGKWSKLRARRKISA